MIKKSDFKMIGFIFILSLLLLPLCTPATQSNLISEPLGAPFGVRDYSFPDFLILGFAAAASAPLGRGHSAYEMHYSVVNDHQVSPAVANYLIGIHGGDRRSLTSTDIDFILSLPKGESYYIDGEVSMLEFTTYWGLTNDLDFGINVNFIAYGGGFLDSTIYDFHDNLDLGQHSRDQVIDNDFLVVLGLQPGNPLVFLKPPTSGGLSDPSFFLRYAFPDDYKGWNFNLTTGLKVPLADEDVFLSTGSWDAGFQFIADKRYLRDAFIINAGIVYPGDIKKHNMDLSSLPFVNLSWLHGFEGQMRKRFFLQMLFSEHPFHETVNTQLSDIQFQITAGLKYDTSVGVIGIGFTENILNFNNTPDLGLHFTWDILK